MSAAYYLAKMNLSVTVFEAAHEPGGLLRYAMPEFRLPQKVLDEQFSQLKSVGGGNPDGCGVWPHHDDRRAFYARVFSGLVGHWCQSAAF